MIHGRKGITAVIATIMLLIIAVAIVGVAYAFIIGIVGSTTGKAIFLSGAATCDNTGKTTVSFKNVGTQTILNGGPAPGGTTAGDITITRTSCTPGGSGKCTALGTTTVTYNGDVAPNTQGSISDSGCGVGQTCVYRLELNAVSYTARADC